MQLEAPEAKVDTVGHGTPGGKIAKLIGLAREGLGTRASSEPPQVDLEIAVAEQRGG